MIDPGELLRGVCALIAIKILMDRTNMDDFFEWQNELVKICKDKKSPEDKILDFYENQMADSRG